MQLLGGSQRDIFSIYVSKESAPWRKVGRRPRGFQRAGPSRPDPKGVELQGLTDPVSADNLVRVTTLWRFDNGGDHLGSHLTRSSYGADTVLSSRF